MIAAFLRPFLTPLMIAGGVAAALAAFALYDWLIDDPAVARAARTEYVQKAELVAAQTELALARLSAEAARKAASDYAAKLNKIEAEQILETERIQQEILDYEAQLQAADRACRLDDADIEWLRKP